ARRATTHRAPLYHSPQTRINTSAPHEAEDHASVNLKYPCGFLHDVGADGCCAFVVKRPCCALFAGAVWVRWRLLHVPTHSRASYDQEDDRGRASTGRMANNIVAAAGASVPLGISHRPSNLRATKRAVPLATALNAIARRQLLRRRSRSRRHGWGGRLGFGELPLRMHCECQ